VDTVVPLGPGSRFPEVLVGLVFGLSFALVFVLLL
jgi:hypothetical protein